MDYNLKKYMIYKYSNNISKLKLFLIFESLNLLNINYKYVI